MACLGAGAVEGNDQGGEKKEMRPVERQGLDHGAPPKMAREAPSFPTALPLFFR